MRDLLNRTGFDLYRLRTDRIAGGHSHSRIIPHASYSPWLDDAAFRHWHAIVADSTMVDIYRCWELWALAGRTAGLPGDCLEVGVWRGGTGCLIAKKCELVGSKSRVWLCDTFAGVVKAGEADPSYRGGEHKDTSPDHVRDLATGMGLANVEILKGIFPEETSHRLGERPIRLCHIDVDVYRSAKDILEWVWPRLPHGGVVVFDDYGFASTAGVTRLVQEEYVEREALLIENLNGHGLLIKV